MDWFVLILVLALGIGVMALKRRTLPDIEEPDTELDDAEMQRAAVELHAIRQRLAIAWTRAELTREADQLRRELADEMRRIEVLEAMSDRNE